jgi:hypothetical protein
MMPVTTPTTKLIRKIPEELGQSQVDRVLLDQSPGLQAGDRQRQADRQRDEDEVIHGGDPELPSDRSSTVIGLP